MNQSKQAGGMHMYQPTASSCFFSRKKFPCVSAGHAQAAGIDACVSTGKQLDAWISINAKSWIERYANKGVKDRTHPHCEVIFYRHGCYPK